MCLLLFGVDAHPRHRLVVAANRDEVHARPAAPLAWWDDAPDVLAGRDLEAGGTWMGVTRDGRWAALTNVRDPLNPRPSERSRGDLVADFLRQDILAEAYAAQVFADRDAYDGFNLVLADRDGVWSVSRRVDHPVTLGPGVYGLSNDRLDTPWPKVERGRRLLRAALADDAVATDALLDLLDDQHQPPDAALPKTGVGLEWERRLAPMRIVSDGYGTRVSTALLVGRDGEVEVAEQTWRPDGSSAGPAQRVLLSTKGESEYGRNRTD